MVKVTEFAFVGYPVTDEKRARDFYQGVLNLTPSLELKLEHGLWIEYEIGPHTLAISSMWKPENKSGPCVALEMADYDETITALKAANVKFEMDTYESPGCHFCIVNDPDGNQLMIHKRKPSRD